MTIKNIKKRKTDNDFANFNISTNDNRIISLGKNTTGEDLDYYFESSGWVNNIRDFKVEVGEPIGQFYGYVTEGFYDLDDFDYDASTGEYSLKDGVASSSAAALGSKGVNPGDLKLRDLNGDGVIDDDDKTVLGNSQPDFFGGLSQQFRYKNFDLTVFFRGKFDFDILDPTKLIPEEMVPVQRIGKMTLNRNPDNFFAETEQVAFHPGHVVPGIDFTNDPLLQGRLFSYTDTQLSRLGSPNFHEIPINRPINETHNNQRDAQMRMTVDKGKTAYFPNSIGGGCPHLAKMAQGGFTSYEERIDAKKIRSRSSSFSDHYSQPALFYRSLTDWEQEHVADAYTFELGKCTYDHIKERMLYVIKQIDKDLALKVADGLGMKIPSKIDQPINQAIGADANVEEHQPTPKKKYLKKSAALSLTHLNSDSIATRKIAFLVGDGFNGAQVKKIKEALVSKNAVVHLVAPHGGTVKCDLGKEHPVDVALLTTESVLYDALYIPGGAKSIEALVKAPKSVKFVNETLKHCKALAAEEDTFKLLDKTAISMFDKDAAILIGKTPKDFIKQIAAHRNWDRQPTAMNIPV